MSKINLQRREEILEEADSICQSMSGQIKSPTIKVARGIRAD